MRTMLRVFTACLLTLPTVGQIEAQERAVSEEEKATRRIALLIGNEDYIQTSPVTDYAVLTKLNNPCNDVEAVSAKLEQSGWAPDDEIILVCNADLQSLRAAIDRFKDTYLSSDHSFGFIYYAGHGVQVGNETYLFGTDSLLNLKRAAELAGKTIPGSIFRGGVRLYADVISQVGDAGSGSIFIVIDACRETPIDKLLRDKGMTVAGGKYPDPVIGVRLLYSTKYGQLSSDGATSASPFSQVFVETLDKAGEVDDLIRFVVKDVAKNTRNSSIPQVPDTSGSLNPPPPASCLTMCGETQ